MTEKILFVDDDPNILSGYRRKFIKKYDIYFANDAFEAIGLIKSQKFFNVIVSDFKMPGMNGVELFSIVRKISPSSIRILATGYADMNIAIGAINEGNIFRFLQKPFKDSIISNAIEDALRQHKLETIEKSDRLKNEFLSILSHEIRTPLNSITNFVQILEDELNDKMSSELKSFSGIIKINAERLIRTVHLMIDLSSIYSSNYKLEFKNFDVIEKIIQPLILNYKIKAQEKEIELEFTTDLKIYEMFLDEYSLNQIISNLIDNAITFTETGKVNISLIKSEDSILIILEDTGIGISKEFIDKMYDPFIQEMTGYTRLYEGNGLGLTLVKEFCNLNGFTIDVESVKNIGTKFTLTISKHLIS